jgi:hypothetical protein
MIWLLEMRFFGKFCKYFLFSKKMNLYKRSLEMQFLRAKVSDFNILKLQVTGGRGSEQSQIIERSGVPFGSIPLCGTNFKLFKR